MTSFNGPVAGCSDHSLLYCLVLSGPEDVLQSLVLIWISVCTSEVHQQDEQHQEESQGDAPENNPQYTTVYVGNLAHEVSNDHRRFFGFF